MRGWWLNNVNHVTTSVMLGLALTSSVCSAAVPGPPFGSLLGSVRDGAGVPQMGAVVQLYNRQERFLEKVLTNASGQFVFASLAPDFYSVRVTLNSFVPALKKNIAVHPGLQSVLAINMAGLVSSIELVYTSRNPGTLMSDDWKWVLRSTMTTRPVTRMLPGIDISDPNRAPVSTTAMFSDTRGIVKLSAGETPSPFTLANNQPDLGTTFALATSFFGQNNLQFSGNFGYAVATDLPAAGFRTTFRRPDLGPEVKLTVQQIGLPSRPSPVLGQANSSAPVLRTMSVTVIERTELMDGLDLDYGASLDSVTYLDRLNYFSPFARLRYQVGGGTLDLGYSSGAPPIELLNAREDELSLQNDLAALSVLPRVSLRNGKAHIQRTENMEAGYSIHIGSRTYSVGAYHEFVRNAALTFSAPESFAFYSGDLLPELSSSSSVFNIGNYRRYGYTASATQSLGENFSASLAYGRGGVLTTEDGALQSFDPEELRGRIRRAQRHWARLVFTGTVPVTGTRFTAGYEWSDAQALTPGHVFLTQKVYPETGLNVRLRQPVPVLSGLPGRLEATAELRNILAQGYLPLSTSDGHSLILANYPRAVRGGLSFIF